MSILGLTLTSRVTVTLLCVSCVSIFLQQEQVASLKRHLFDSSLITEQKDAVSYTRGTFS